MSDATVLSELNEGVLTITLNRPKVNAFNEEMIAATQEAFKRARREEAVRCVVLTGRGKVFSAGQDVSEMSVMDDDFSFRAHLLKTYNPLILEMRRLEKPVLAAINGAVAGAGLGVALACDLRVAAEGARLVIGFGGIGLAPDSAVSLILPQLIGLGRAAEAAFFNQPISAEQALAWGLVNKVVADEALMEEAHAWAARLAAGPVKAMGLTKRAFNKAILPQLEAVLDYEAYIQDIAGKGSDHREGLTAFLEKREPNYAKTSE